MSLLGIDLGTTGCKAAAFSVGGEVLATAYREYATLHPRDGWAELDSRQVMARVWESIAEVEAHTAHETERGFHMGRNYKPTPAGSRLARVGRGAMFPACAWSPAISSASSSPRSASPSRR